MRLPASSFLPSFALALVILMPTLAQAPRLKRQEYTGWRYDKVKKYHYREYRYLERAGDKAYKRQYVIYKPQRTKHYVYWFNPEKKVYWARCATVNHPRLGNQVKMLKDFWGMLPNEKKKDSLDAIREGDFGPDRQMSPPIPGSGDGATIECPPIDLPPS